MCCQALSPIACTVPRTFLMLRTPIEYCQPIFRGTRYKRREALSDTIEALIDEFARHCAGYTDDVVVVDSTPVETCRSRQTVKRGGSSSLDDALANAADYGYCASHSRYFYGFRLHALFALDGTPRALALTGAKVGERDVALGPLI